jgi:DNA-binding NarL/FixJ family response regulator
LPGAIVGLLVVDDQDAFRALVRDVVAATPGFAVVAEARSGEEAIEAAQSVRPDLVLMDVRMPGLGGRAAARALADRYPEMIVWLVTADAPSALSGPAACGAAALVDKRDFGPRRLRELWEPFGRASNGAGDGSTRAVDRSREPAALASGRTRS